MNPGAHFRPQMSRAINTLFPVVSPRSFGTRASGTGLEIQPPTYQYTPVMVLPYGNSYIVQPVAYYPSPYYGQPVQMTRNYATQPDYYQNRTPRGRREAFPSNVLSTSPPRTGTITDNQMFSSIKNFGYATKKADKDKKEAKRELTTAEILEETERKEKHLRELQALEEASRQIKITDTMTASELHQSIMLHFQVFPRARLSWFNKLLVKVETKEDWYKALEVFDKFHERVVDISPETGTLIIKAACRAGVPEHALALLNDLQRVRIWPTLGGIHYLMINFSLKKDTKSVRDTFIAARARQLQPTMRTYQIIIRECVDNGLIDDAMHFAEESEKEGLIPNRVTYNILMNGLRKANRAQEILTLREKMEKQAIEINDTTIKFTAVAKMMMQDATNAVKEFLSYPELNEKLEQFCDKFFEITEDSDATQKKQIVDLLDAVAASGTTLPPSTLERLSKLKASL